MFDAWLQSHSLQDFPLEHRLFEKATNRDYWSRYLGQAQIQNAEALLNYNWPMIRASQYMAFHQTGNRMVQEKPHFARRDALITLFLGELAEYKGRFLPDLCDGMFAICEETFWGISAHFSMTRQDELLPSVCDPCLDLFAAETAELLSVIYHILYDALYAFCPPILERIEYEIDRRIVTPYCNRYDFWWMGNTPKKPNNWTPWILQNLLTVAVTIPMSSTRRTYALAKMFAEMDRYYQILPKDGGCDEGSSYWTKAGAKLFAFCDVLYITSGGKIDFFRDEKLKNIGLFEAISYIGECRFVNFSDGVNLISSINMDYALYAFGKRIGEERLCQFAHTFRQDRIAAHNGIPPQEHGSIKEQLFSLVYAADIDSQPFYKPQPVAVLPQLQTAYLRHSDWYAAIKGGHNAEAHNHNDVGSFIVYFNSEPVLIDPGIGTYTKQTFSSLRYTLPGTQSAYHNLPMINGIAQKEGAQYRADRFEADGLTVTVSFAQAYPKAAAVTEAVRTLYLHEEGVDLLDTFTLASPGEICEHFMTPLSVTVQEDAVCLGERFVLRVENATVSVDRMDFEGDLKYKSDWDCEGLNRIRFTLRTPQARITVRRLP